jgi:hypothetical protein
MTVPLKEAPANYVPAAAVIRKGRALSGFTGHKGRVGGFISQMLNTSAQLKSAFETILLEIRRGKRNSQCSGEMRRYCEEHQLRRRLPRLILTLRRESVGSERD